MTSMRTLCAQTLAALCLCSALAVAQDSRSISTPPVPGTGLPNDYVIGIEDVLGIVFWREQDKNLTTDVVVRPDGKISVPMLNDLKAAGLTPEQLAASVEQAASKFIRDAAATVVVREIHSRKIFVIGEVAKPGTVQIGSELNVLQAIAEAGGFLDTANKSNVVIVRQEAGRERRFNFNYKDVVKGKKLEQNIKLLPGDTLLVR